MNRLFYILLLFSCVENFSIACSEKHPFPFVKLYEQSDIAVMAKITDVVPLNDEEFYQVTMEIISVSKGTLTDKVITITLYFKEDWKGFTPSELYAGQTGQFFLKKSFQDKKLNYSGYAYIFKKF